MPRRMLHQYLPDSSPTAKDEETVEFAEIVLSNKGGPKLIHNGFMYTLHKKQTNNIRWRCVFRTSQCRGSLVTTLDYKMPSVRMEHNHVADYGAARVARKRYLAMGQPPVFPEDPLNYTYSANIAPSATIKEEDDAGDEESAIAVEGEKPESPNGEFIEPPRKIDANQILQVF